MPGKYGRYGFPWWVRRCHVFTASSCCTRALSNTILTLTILTLTRYLSNTAPGFASPLLDECGGHSHEAGGSDEHGNSLSTYHYHTQASVVLEIAASVAVWPV